MITARCLAVGLRLGLVEYAEIQSWVDKQILSCDLPSGELLLLAYAKQEDMHEIYNLLKALSDETNEYAEIREHLSEIKKQRLDSIEFCSRLAKCLYHVWVENDYTAPDDLAAIGFLDDEYTMAINGTFGTVEEWHANFKKFITALANGS